MKPLRCFSILLGLFHCAIGQSHWSSHYYPQPQQIPTPPALQQVYREPGDKPCEHISHSRFDLKPVPVTNPCPFIPLAQVDERNNFGVRRPKKIKKKLENLERISGLKCKEYKNLTTETIFHHSMSFAEAQSLQFEKCVFTGGLIVGGEKASENEFPHMGAVGHEDVNGIKSFQCGCSLISDRFTLTVAHCRSKEFIPSVVRFGAIKLNDSQYLDSSIKSFIIHEDYNSTLKQNDIALIELKESVEFSKSIRPACLWLDKGIESEGALAVGWGTTGYGTSQTNDLMKVQLDILANSLCVKYFKDSGVTITEKQVCSGVLEGGKDTCTGDSGGPLQIYTPDNNCTAHIIGLTSYGGFCGGKNSSSIYTRVSSYIDWIERKVWG